MSRMAPSDTNRVQRLRSQAIWAFTIAVVCLAAALLGAVQYSYSGAVSMRPGHEPIVGTAALESLFALVVVGILFTAAGMAIRSRAKRHRDT